jgi:hypothetical protein
MPIFQRRRSLIFDRLGNTSAGAAIANLDLDNPSLIEQGAGYIGHTYPDIAPC